MTTLVYNLSVMNTRLNTLFKFCSLFSLYIKNIVIVSKKQLNVGLSVLYIEFFLEGLK